MGLRVSRTEHYVLREKANLFDSRSFSADGVLRVEASLLDEMPLGDLARAVRDVVRWGSTEEWTQFCLLLEGPRLKAGQDWDSAAGRLEQIWSL